jgi:hypothetical protein
MMSDHEYRQKLIWEGGARPELVGTLIGRDLDCVGNILRVYRTWISFAALRGSATARRKRFFRRTWLGLFRWRVIWTSRNGDGRVVEQGVTGRMMVQIIKPPSKIVPYFSTFHL